MFSSTNIFLVSNVINPLWGHAEWQFSGASLSHTFIQGWTLPDLSSGPMTLCRSADQEPSKVLRAEGHRGLPAQASLEDHPLWALTHCGSPEPPSLCAALHFPLPTLSIPPSTPSAALHLLSAPSTACSLISKGLSLTLPVVLTTGPGTG